MDIQDIRRARLAQLIQERYGSQAQFIEQTNENQGEVSALLRDKSFGEKKARKLEKKCGLPAYWLDGDMAPISASTQAREVARAFDLLTPKQQGAVITMIESYGLTVTRHEAGTAAEQESSKLETRAITLSTTQITGQKQSFGSS
ncbi:hypothetical protein [Herbaspirillum sp. ST 5-3]|uniref:hypothetical protein n=1 Tax=Oxalobacteraceae TaxID=75682 RepID=UPI0010A59500|nr:hypothetical protein [Herbaspirillum sp. ST 5-3]